MDNMLQCGQLLCLLGNGGTLILSPIQRPEEKESNAVKNSVRTESKANRIPMIGSASLSSTFAALSGQKKKICEWVE